MNCAPRKLLREQVSVLALYCLTACDPNESVLGYEIHWYQNIKTPKKYPSRPYYTTNTTHSPLTTWYLTPPRHRIRRTSSLPSMGQHLRPSTPMPHRQQRTATATLMLDVLEPGGKVWNAAEAETHTEQRCYTMCGSATDILRFRQLPRSAHRAVYGCSALLERCEWNCILEVILSSSLLLLILLLLLRYGGRIRAVRVWRHSWGLNWWVWSRLSGWILSFVVMVFSSGRRSAILNLIPRRSTILRWRRGYMLILMLELMGSAGGSLACGLGDSIRHDAEVWNV